MVDILGLDRWKVACLTSIIDNRGSPEIMAHILGASHQAGLFRTIGSFHDSLCPRLEQVDRGRPRWRHVLQAAHLAILSSLLCVFWCFYPRSQISISRGTKRLPLTLASLQRDSPPHRRLRQRQRHFPMVPSCLLLEHRNSRDGPWSRRIRAYLPALLG